MKHIIFALLFFQLLVAQELPQLPSPGDGVMIVPIDSVRKVVPVFFSASSHSKVRLLDGQIATESEIHYQLLQGKPEMLSLALTGSGDVHSVVGDGLLDWAQRVGEDGARYLDVRPKADLPERKEWVFVVKSLQKIDAAVKQCDVLLPGKGAAVGYSMHVALLDDESQVRVVKAEGLAPVGEVQDRQFVGTTQGLLSLDLSESDGVIALQQSELRGQVAADGKSIAFTLTATASVKLAGAAVELLDGSVALTGASAGDGWRVALRAVGDHFVYDLIAEREGAFLLEIQFSVAVRQDGDWRSIDALLPAGVVVPLWLDGLTTMVKFDAARPVVPVIEGGKWHGFLPADGRISCAWRESRSDQDGALFFSSSEVSDVRVGSGLLRQTSTIDFRILQGKLQDIVLAIDGPGEVLSVAGEQVLGWRVELADGKRSLHLQLSRPMEGKGTVIVEAQLPLEEFPCKTSVPRLLPVGSLRHNGWLRIANEGAVKLEMSEPKGLIQVAPEQFPLLAKDLRQSFVYRFPTAEYSYQVLADHVLPETMVMEQTIYELAETDRRIISTIELDIREAPLREWEIEVPEDYTVVSCTGAAVADFMLATQADAGRKRLKIHFTEAVKDRQLLQLRLEKNEAAKSGDWSLMPLRFPQAKSQRGFVGVVAAAGYRLTARASEKLVEIPLSYFPQQSPGLQQAFRIREGEWSATITVEALGQSVQADVFHLYSIKEGTVYGSVLFNYFVVGAPATEWRVELPETLGNIDITGQNIGREWQRKGNVLVIPLSRPLMGAGTMLLSFEQPIPAAGGTISPGEVRPLQVQSERGYMQVVSPLQVNYEELQRSGSVLSLQSSELPAEYRMLSSAPTLGAWQYTARDFSLGLKFSWYKAGDTVEQVVDFVKLSSQVSRDGQWVTEATFYVKSKRQESLRMKLPAGAELWETKVQGVTANPRDDKGEIVIPLPQNHDLNQPVEISLRYGLTSKKATLVTLTAPILQAPTVMGEWTVVGDEGRVLTPVGGTVELVKMTQWENGFSWMARNRTLTISFAIVLMLALWFVRRGKVSWLAYLILLGASVCLGIASATSHSAAPSVLEFVAPVVNAGSVMAIELQNASAFVTQANLGVWLLAGVGVAVWLRGKIKADRWWMFCGALAMACAVLSVRGGAPWFFLAVAVLSLVMLLQTKRRGAVVRAALMFVAGVCLLDSPSQAEISSAQKTADTMQVDAAIKENRLYGSIDVSVRAEAGDRFAFLQAPAVLGEFTGDGLRVLRQNQNGVLSYVLLAEKAGQLSGKARFEMPLADPQQAWILPCAAATIRKLSLRWDRSGWEFSSAAAADHQLLAGLTENESGTVMLLKPSAVVELVAQAKQRDVATEKPVYFIETSQLMLPMPGVIHGKYSILVRPSQGQLSELIMQVPKGFTVSDVSAGPIGVWRFDPEKSQLRVAIEPAQAKAFSFVVETQQASAALPVEVMLEPLRVIGAAGEVGLLAIALGDDAQVEKSTPEGLSLVNPDDFSAALIPKNAKGEALAVVQHVYRYGSSAASLLLRITPVAPEMRAESWQVLSLGDDRLLLAAELQLTITRAGMFRLLLDVPDGLEIETVSGSSLSHWTETMTDKKRLLTLHLQGRTMGQQSFHLTFTGPALRVEKEWQVPHLVLREATRSTGIMTIVPEQGMRLAVVKREHISPLDPREWSDVTDKHAAEAMRSGALSFRLLQDDWQLSLSVDQLDAWVTAQVFHEMVLREGQMSSSVTLNYQIENAGKKLLRVRIPGLSEIGAATVRATGDQVADFIKIDGQPDLWEIRCKHSISGSHQIQIEFQQQLAEAAAATIQPLVLDEAKQVTYYAAVRTAGRLELQWTDTLPDGWARSDWAVLQTAWPKLRSMPAPAMTFKVSETKNSLSIPFQRHQLATMQKMRVTDGQLTTLISAKGQALTAVNLQIQVAEKGRISLRLPVDAQLYHVLVNDESVSLVRENDAWLFYVFPSPDASKPASLRFVYAASAGENMKLEGPSVNVPMESINWRVLIPDGWKMKNYDGDFELKESGQVGSFRLQNYQDFVKNRKVSSSADAVALLDQANDWLAKGDQEKASIALGNAARNSLLDEASNEDARVQLRELKTQQAVLGLNTRRQRIVLDNLSETQTSNQQLEQAATVNPVLQGNYNYDPKQFDRFIEGNTAEENAALTMIANRIVSQQLAAEPVAQGIEVAVPERGTLLTFGRSIQLPGDRPMTLNLQLQRNDRPSYWLGILLCVLLAALLTRRLKRKNP